MEATGQAHNKNILNWTQARILIAILILGWTAAPVNAAVIGEVTTSVKDMGSTYEVALRVNFDWLGLAAVHTQIAALKVPKNGTPTSAKINVPGGSFSTTAYLKNNVITIQIIARTLAGQTRNKTFSLPAENTSGIKRSSKWTKTSWDWN